MTKLLQAWPLSKVWEDDSKTRFFQHLKLRIWQEGFKISSTKWKRTVQLVFAKAIIADAHT